MTSLAVVIPAFRSERTIRRCLELFARRGPGCRARSWSTARPMRASATVARSGSAESRVDRSADRRLLPHAARNLGAACETDAPLLLFTDPDIYPPPGSSGGADPTHSGETGGAVAAVRRVSWETTHLDRAAPRREVRPAGSRARASPCDRGRSDVRAPRPACRRGTSRGTHPPSRGCSATRSSRGCSSNAGVPLHLAGEAVFEHDHGAALRHARPGALRPWSRVRGAAAASVRPGERRTRPRRSTTTLSAGTPRAGHRYARRELRLAPRRSRGGGRPRFRSSRLRSCAWFAGELAGMAAGPGSAVR